MNTRPLIIALIVIVLLVLAYLLFFANDTENEPQTATSTPSAATTTTNPPAAPAPAASTPTNVTVTYGANGFSPASVTVPVGSTVTWVNEGAGRMWVATARHPDHTVYDGTSTDEHCTDTGPTSAAVFDQCAAGSRYSFTFTRAGTFAYHNHADARHFGSVTVTPR